MTQPKHPKTRIQYTPPIDNLARQTPVPNLFEEFTEIISGELRTLNLTGFEQEFHYPENTPGYRHSKR